MIQAAGDNFKPQRHVEPIPAMWQRKFVETLVLTRSVSEACKAIHRKRTDVYEFRRQNDEFRSLWNDAVEQNADDLESTCLRKAIEGWQEPVFYRGERVGYKTVYSPPLMMFMLRCLKPDKYNPDKAQQESTEELAGALRAAVGQMVNTVPRETANVGGDSGSS